MDRALNTSEASTLDLVIIFYDRSTSRLDRDGAHNDHAHARGV